jgi:hypothetical protein
MFHGTPVRDDEYLLTAVDRNGAGPRDAEAVAARLEGLSQGLVLCGHDHTQRTLSLPGGRGVVNPGSVGLPAYSEARPHPHRIEAGSPRARYTLIEISADRYRIEEIQVDYNWGAAAAAARENGRPDWGRWLETGRV